MACWLAADSRVHAPKTGYIFVLYGWPPKHARSFPLPLSLAILAYCGMLKG